MPELDHTASQERAEDEDRESIIDDGSYPLDASQVRRALQPFVDAFDSEDMVAGGLLVLLRSLTYTRDVVEREGMLFAAQEMMMPHITSINDTLDELCNKTHQSLLKIDMNDSSLPGALAPALQQSAVVS